MTTQTRFRNWFARRATRTIRKPSRPFRPWLLSLEDRCVPATFTVTNIHDDGSNGSLRWAINQANKATEASTIQFDPGVFNTQPSQRITLNGSLRTSGDGQNSLYLTNTDSPISIIGPSDGVWIQGAPTIAEHVNHVFWVDAGVTASIQNVTIASGFNESPVNGGAGLHNEGTVNLNNCIFLGNLSLYGGALENWGTATVSNSRFSGNTAFPDTIDQYGDGGAILNQSGATITLNSTEISANSADQSGGGLFNAGTATLNNCTLDRNTSANDGGGIYNSGQNADLHLNGCTITGNTSKGYGGGVANELGGINLMGCTLTGNSANDGGGGLHTDNGFISLVNCTISHNTSAGAGGGLGNGGYGYGQINLDNCIVNFNVAVNGAGILNLGTTILTNSSVSGNTASNNGGGIANYSGSLSLNNCTIGGNTAHITKSGQDYNGYGGGIYNYADATVTNSTINYNAVGFGGAGIYNDGNLKLVNSTVSYNATQDEGWGGGLYNHDNATLINVTISQNSATGLGGGIYTDYSLTLSNTIVAANRSDPGQPGYDILLDADDITSLGHNLIGVIDGSGTPWVNTDLVGTLQSPLDPKLAAFANNGGPTQTMALLPGSPAIGKGALLPGITTDQRGFPMDSPPDIGAFQTQTHPVDSTARILGPAAGQDVVFVVSNEKWTATSNVGWLHTSSTGSGNGVAVFTFDANPGGTRTGTMDIDGRLVTVTQAGNGYVAANPVVPLVSAGLNNLAGIAIDAAGNIYMADYGANVIRRWDAATQVMTTLVASGLSQPTDVAVDTAGNVYIADSGNLIKKWDASTKLVSTLISSGLTGSSGVAVDAAGNLYIADTLANAIRVWNPSSGDLSTLVSSGLSNPAGVDVDAFGNVYIADTYGNAIRAWDAATNQLVTLTTANEPFAVAVDSVGNVFFADTGSNSIRRWDASSLQVTTVYAAKRLSPEGVAVDAAGNVTFAGDTVVMQRVNAYVPESAIKVAAAAGSEALLPVLPSTQHLNGLYAPTRDSRWLTIGKIDNGVIHFNFAENNGPARTAHITVLGQQIAVTQAAGSQLRPNAIRGILNFMEFETIDLSESDLVVDSLIRKISRRR